MVGGGVKSILGVPDVILGVPMGVLGIFGGVPELHGIGGGSQGLHHEVLEI